VLSVQTLLAALEQQQASKNEMRVGSILGRVVAALIAVAFAGGLLAFAGYRLWLAWQTGQWTGFWMLTIYGILFIIAPFLALARLWNPVERLKRAIGPLRQIAVAREDALTPPVTPQPPALLAEALPIGPVEIKPIKRLMSVAVRNPALFISPRLLFVGLFLLMPMLSDDVDLGQILPTLSISSISSISSAPAPTRHSSLCFR